MYDKGKVVPGLMVFGLLFTLPFLYTRAFGRADYRPMLQLPAGETECVEPRRYMRISHMVLLNEWRDRVVRGGERVYLSSSGREHPMSLSSTCLGCHTSKGEFCDRCHEFLSVKPYCWDCHTDPRGSF
jgi:hypothetical protein